MGDIDRKLAARRLQRKQQQAAESDDSSSGVSTTEDIPSPTAAAPITSPPSLHNPFSKKHVPAPERHQSSGSDGSSHRASENNPFGRMSRASTAHTTTGGGSKRHSHAQNDGYYTSNSAHSSPVPEDAARQSHSKRADAPQMRQPRKPPSASRYQEQHSEEEHEYRDREREKSGEPPQTRNDNRRRGSDSSVGSGTGSDSGQRYSGRGTGGGAGSGGSKSASAQRPRVSPRACDSTETTPRVVEAVGATRKSVSNSVRQKALLNSNENRNKQQQHHSQQHESRPMKNSSSTPVIHPNDTHANTNYGQRPSSTSNSRHVVAKPSSIRHDTAGGRFNPDDRPIGQSVAYSESLSYFDDNGIGFDDQGEENGSWQCLKCKEVSWVMTATYCDKCATVRGNSGARGDQAKIKKHDL